jgi:hypothetical protein
LTASKSLRVHAVAEDDVDAVFHGGINEFLDDARHAMNLSMNTIDPRTRSLEK